MCVTAYSLFTVCGHYPCSEEQRCSVYSSYSALKKKLVYCCDSELRAVKFVFGWCPECTKVLFENTATRDKNGKQKVTYAFETRNIEPIRRYWEYKFIMRSANAIEPTKSLRLVVNHDRDMVKDIQTWTAINTINGLLDVMKFVRDFSLRQRAMYFDKLTADEATLQRALYTLKPSEIWLGPKKHDYAIASWDRFATLLHKARLGTIMWASGNDEVYEKELGVSTHWECPYATGFWKVARYGEVAAGSTEVPCISELTWHEELKSGLEASMEALSHIMES
ncbi:hypothetical protein HDV63DRAFT_402210 [Trichoderma sp. SZMC 28014]